MVPQPAPDDTHERILRATLELIGERGISSVSIRNVARSAGVSLGTLTYQFDSQASLLRESLALFIDEETERLTSLTDQLATAELTGEQAARALESMLSSEPARRLAKLDLYLRAAHDPEIREAALRCFAAYDELVASALRSLGVSSAEQMAPVIVAVIDGLQLRRLASGEEQLNLAQPLATLLKGIGVPP